MRDSNTKECDPHTNESDVLQVGSTASVNNTRKNAKRLPLADIRNVQEDLSKRFIGK